MKLHTAVSGSTPMDMRCFVKKQWRSVHGGFKTQRLLRRVLVTYDVNTETAAGRRRLRKVAKVCVDYGQRVQNSVFECLLDAAQYTMFKAKLTELIDSESDSLRFYQLGNHYKSKVEHVGLHPDFDQDGILFA